MPTAKDRLQRLRATLGLSQRDLAEMLAVSNAALSSWESGARELPPPVAKLLGLLEQEAGVGEPPAPPKVVGALAEWRKKLDPFRAFAADLFLAQLDTLARGGALASEVKAAAARSLVAQLGELKGLSMKVGQLVATLDVLMEDPAPWTPLRLLHDHAHALPRHVVVDACVAAFGAPPNTAFEAFDPKPFALGSVGQVHRASYAGQPVAVKIQYPGIAESLFGELHVAKRLTQLAARVFDRPIELAAALEQRVQRELDYCREAELQAAFAAAMAEVPGVVVPKVLDARSGARVLTSEYVAGQRFDAFTRSASQAERDAAGALLYEAFFVGLFRHGVFNADQHPGNYLFSEGRLVCVDFGFAERLAPPLLEAFRRELEDERAGRPPRYLFHALGLFVSDEIDWAAHRAMFLSFNRALLSDGPQHFSAAKLRATFREFKANPNARHTRMPAEFSALTLGLWGLYALLAKLDATVDTTRVNRAIFAR